MNKIAIVVPCYNEEEMLEVFYQEVKKQLVPDYDFYFIFIDDGSKDKTMEIIKSLNTKDPKVKFVSFSRNFGKRSSNVCWSASS